METGAVWEAFSRFARAEIGAEPKTLLKAWFEPILSEIEAVEDTLDWGAVDPKRLEEYESVLRRLWGELVP